MNDGTRIRAQTFCIQSFEHFSTMVGGCREQTITFTWVLAPTLPLPGQGSVQSQIALVWFHSRSTYILFLYRDRYPVNPPWFDFLPSPILQSIIKSDVLFLFTKCSATWPLLSTSSLTALNQVPTISCLKQSHQAHDWPHLQSFPWSPSFKCCWWSNLKCKSNWVSISLPSP